MTFEKAEIYRLRRMIRLVKKMEDEKERERRLAGLRAKIEQLLEEALELEKRSLD